MTAGTESSPSSVGMDERALDRGLELVRATNTAQFCAA